MLYSYSTAASKATRCKILTDIKATILLPINTSIKLQANTCRFLTDLFNIIIRISSGYHLDTDKRTKFLIFCDKEPTHANIGIYTIRSIV